MTLCSVELCPRGEGIVAWFGVDGPPLCGKHRAEWAADNLDAVSKEERAAYVERFTFTTPKGERFTTWPVNFGSPVR